MNTEVYYLKFKSFLLESERKEKESDESDLKKENDECDCSIEKGCDCNLKKEKLKTEKLTQKEKKKKERDKISHSRKKSWNPHPDTEDLKTPSGYKELQSLSRGITEKKKRKKQCIPGNANHAASDGRFVDPYKEKGSWSIDKGSTSGKDCSWGQASRKSANRSQQFVKRDCGRNAKYRCKDGSPKWENLNPEMNSSLSSATFDELIDELMKRLESRDLVEGRGFDINKGLEFCAAIASADKGVWPPKK